MCHPPKASGDIKALLASSRDDKNSPFSLSLWTTAASGWISSSPSTRKDAPSAPPPSSQDPAPLSTATEPGHSHSQPIPTPPVHPNLEAPLPPLSSPRNPHPSLPCPPLPASHNYATRATLPYPDARDAPSHRPTPATPLPLAVRRVCVKLKLCPVRSLQGLLRLACERSRSWWCPSAPRVRRRRRDRRKDQSEDAWTAGTNGSRWASDGRARCRRSARTRTSTTTAGGTGSPPLYVDSETQAEFRPSKREPCPRTPQERHFISPSTHPYSHPSSCLRLIISSLMPSLLAGREHAMGPSDRDAHVSHLPAWSGAHPRTSTLFRRKARQGSLLFTTLHPFSHSVDQRFRAGPANSRSSIRDDWADAAPTSFSAIVMQKSATELTDTPNRSSIPVSYANRNRRRLPPNHRLIHHTHLIHLLSPPRSVPT